MGTEWDQMDKWDTRTCKKYIIVWLLTVYFSWKLLRTVHGSHWWRKWQVLTWSLACSNRSSSCHTSDSLHPKAKPTSWEDGSDIEIFYIRFPEAKCMNFWCVTSSVFAILTFPVCHIQRILPHPYLHSDSQSSSLLQQHYEMTTSTNPGCKGLSILIFMAQWAWLVCTCKEPTPTQIRNLDSMHKDNKMDRETKLR
jgi:hypothetical protein